MKKYYTQSTLILQEIKKAHKILLNAHRNPDLDSIGASTALAMVLKKMGKKVQIVCPHEVASEFMFIKGASDIETINFKDFKDFQLYDLFLILDSGSFDIITGSKEVELPDMKKIVIDHHRSNSFTDVGLRLVEEKAAATCEIVYKIFSDWGVDIDSDLATALFSGIAGDTVFFRYSENTKEMYKIIADLIDKGANKDTLVEKMFNNYSFGFVKLLGEFLDNMKLEKVGERAFVWSALPYRIFKKYGFPKGARETAADLFFQSVKGTSFGLAILEEKEGRVCVSFRSIGEKDVSGIARALGGGGHRNAAGATVMGGFSASLKIIIDKAKKLV